MRSAASTRNAPASAAIAAPDAASLVVDVLDAINWTPGAGSGRRSPSVDRARAAEAEGAALWGMPAGGMFGQMWAAAHHSLRGAEPRTPGAPCRP
ncbi:MULTISPECIES: hypothetical protein [unclassified Streptomyces]|uniref:hypothetical protein n=1 Tax=unclassified Streptomyces TaxID=2593676 RepID=UPI000DC3B028|nr:MULTISPECIES: hypothetical protein [unclassified Streptomyces]MYT71589.1 hypothetical protein [Streptomyces sp. SID8367]RAJ66813.1 hypothetical protein K377_08247 [Streptomyces sp. PsTaAH-137]